MKSWRLLDTGALPGKLNMSIDKALLSLHKIGKSPPTLRFYQWSPPAISLGYFQRKHDIDLSKCRERGIDVVNRPTGGRAVLHRNDLTYSLIAGTRDGIPSTLMASYHLICQGLIAGFRHLGFDAETGQEHTSSSESDICFMRFAAGDIIYQGKKFVGSAQKWTGSSLLQHGSVILESQTETWSAILKSSASEEELRKKLTARMTSLDQILNRKTEIAEVKAALITGMAQILGINFQTGDLLPEEWESANATIAE